MSLTGPILTAAELQELRADEESMMQDTIAFRRPTGRTEQNESSGGREVPVYQPIFTSPGRVGGRRGGAEPTIRTVTIGGAERTLIVAGIEIPVGDQVLKANDEAVVTAVGPSTEPAALNAVYRLVDVTARSWATKRSFDVEQIR